MSNNRIQELKDDNEANSAVDSVTSSLKNLLKYVNNPVDFSRLMEAVMKWMIKNKQSLRAVENNTNFKQVMTYLNKMQSEKPDESQPKNTQ